MWNNKYFNIVFIEYISRQYFKSQLLAIKVSDFNMKNKNIETYICCSICPNLLFNKNWDLVLKKKKL